MNNQYRISPLTLLGVLILWFVPLPRLMAAAPKLDALYPAGAAQGQSVSVQLHPAPKIWPVEIWVDPPLLKISVEKTKGKITVNVPPETPCGIYQLRVFNKEGASVIRSFVVGRLPELNEKEPNNDPTLPQKIDSSVVINGQLIKSGDVDTFALQLQKGQTVVAAMQANETLGSPMDSILQICNAQGFVLTQNDDERGIDPFIPFTAPVDGTYLVRTFAFPIVADSRISFAGSASYVYRLTLTTQGFIDHAMPLSLSADQSTEVKLLGWNLPSEAETVVVQPQKDQAMASVFHAKCAQTLRLPVSTHNSVLALEQSSPAQPQPIELPAVISGRIESPKDSDTFRFHATKKQRLQFSVDAGKFGYPLSPELRITDTAGKVISKRKQTRGNHDTQFTETFPADGEYDLTIRDLHGLGGFRYVYRLICEEPTADFSLKLAAGEFILTPKKTLEIPVTISRLDRFAGEIEITAVGLPQGVTCESVTSAAKGATAKAVKLKLTGNGISAGGTFEIVGRSKADQPISRSAQFALVSPNSQSSKAWLTVLAKPAKKK